MECLDEETILAFCRGDLDAATRTRAQEHIAGCDECRALVSAVARSSLVDPREVPPEAGRQPEGPKKEAAPEGGGLATDPTELADSSRARPRGPSSSPVGPGDVLAGKYVVDGVLGAGGMGIVVSARQMHLDRRVAVKFLLPAACEVPGAVARFLREGKAAARITSEHVARVIDTGVLDGGAPYLVMEHLEGADLAAVTKDKGRLSWQDAVGYVLQACEAVVEAHALGIVHRDLKPANLFLTKRADGGPLVKVLDFGISKIEGGSRRDLTTASMLMGSPRYMSPEQMLSAKDVDARTDVWAMGVILYELVTGKPVWEADTVPGLSALIATAPAPPLRAHASDAPAALEAVVARCLAKKREDRIASIAELALALEPMANDEGRASIARIVKVAGVERPEPAQQGRRRAPVVALAVGVGALLVTGVVANVAAPAKKAPSTAATIAAKVMETPKETMAAEAAVSITPAPPSASAPAKAPSPPMRRIVAPAAPSPSLAPAPASSASEAPPRPPASSPNRALVDRK